MMCWKCGRAPITRWENGIGLCNKLAHRLSRAQSKKLFNAQRRKRSMLVEADTEERRGIFMAFGMALKEIFRR